MQYRTHTADGRSVSAPDLMTAMIAGWCVGRDCRTCPVNPPSGVSCPTAFTDEEIIKRMGDEIEIVHDEDSREEEDSMEARIQKAVDAFNHILDDNTGFPKPTMAIRTNITSALRPNLAALKLYSEAQRLLGFIDGVTQGPQMQNNAVSDAVEALSEILNKWRDLP